MQSSNSPSPTFRRTFVYLLILSSGFAALSWEVLWQIKSQLALGVSAWGTAVTLAVTMAGMAAGALLAGWLLKGAEVKPVRIYGVLEWVIGAAGLCLAPSFRLVESIDTQVYGSYPSVAPALHLLGIVLALGVPAVALGATLPVFGLMARKYQMSLAVLYGLNTLGAAAGVLVAAFALIPLFGIDHTIQIVAGINLMVGVAAWLLDREAVQVQAIQRDGQRTTSSLSLPLAAWAVLVTGFATLSLEVAWFRSLTASFFSTTAAFSVMLAAVLVALGVGAQLVKVFKKCDWPLGAVMSFAGVFILVATPLVERMDYLTTTTSDRPYLLFVNWFFLTLFVTGPPIVFLGAVLPWILDEQDTTTKWGSLYGFNAFASVLGSVCAAWILLPSFGFACTSWLVGALVVCTGALLTESNKRWAVMVTGGVALALATVLESGVGTSRIQLSTTVSSKPVEILETHEGPDVTISAVAHENGERTLVIDGFVATSQPGDDSERGFIVSYMDWMGHLPMLMHPDPENALVIAFGTGQTANAVRKEGPRSLDIVDINPQVFRLARYFTANDGVLDDPVVHPTVMDGRAYIRRTEQTYDVITLEPMPPTFAGVNALYSQEFYEHAREKLSDDGIIAQWLPFHLVSPYYSASVASTFQSVFPNSILWVDRESKTGILLGTKSQDLDLGTSFPGYQRQRIPRPLTQQELTDSIVLDQAGMELYSSRGRVVTDDNQMLAYGKAAHLTHSEFSTRVKRNFDQLQEVAAQLNNGSTSSQ